MRGQRIWTDTRKARARAEGGKRKEKKEEKVRSSSLAITASLYRRTSYQPQYIDRRSGEKIAGCSNVCVACVGGEEGKKRIEKKEFLDVYSFSLLNVRYTGRAPMAAPTARAVRD